METEFQFTDEGQAAKVAAALEEKKKYNRIKKREERARNKVAREKQKAIDAEAERARAVKRAEEDRIASGEKARAERVAFLTQELTNPQPMPTELLKDGTNYAVFVEQETDNFVDDVCGVGADFQKTYHKLSVHPLGQLILERCGVKPLPQLQEPYSYIFTAEGLKVFHKPHGGISEVWELMPTPNKSGGIYTQPSGYVNSDSVFNAHDADIIAKAKATKYERERTAAKERYRQYIRGVEAKWKAWRAAAREAARATVGG
jgi:hypothetical protein